MPGLGEFMIGIQAHHIKLWYAGEHKNWDLANYELKELQETFDSAERLQPKHQGKQVNLSILMKDYSFMQIQLIQQAIDERDVTGFHVTYDNMVNACNRCHSITGNGFIVIKCPSGDNFSDQVFTASQK